MGRCRDQIWWIFPIYSLRKCGFNPYYPVYNHRAPRIQLCLILLYDSPIHFGDRVWSLICPLTWCKSCLGIIVGQSVMIVRHQNHVNTMFNYSGLFYRTHYINYYQVHPSDSHRQVNLMWNVQPAGRRTPWFLSTVWWMGLSVGVFAFNGLVARPKCSTWPRHIAHVELMDSFLQPINGRPQSHVNVLIWSCPLLPLQHLGDIFWKIRVPEIS